MTSLKNCDANLNLQQARLWKLTLSITLALALAIETISMGFFVSTADSSTITTYTLRLIFAIYTLILGVRSINQNAIEPHSESLWHLSTLTFIASALRFSTAILPSTDALVAEVSHQTLAMLKLFGWIGLAFHFISFIIVSTIQQGPELHFDPEKIYSEKTVASITNVDPGNVCGITGTYFYFVTQDTALFNSTHYSCQHLGNLAFLLHHEGSYVRAYIRFTRNRRPSHSPSKYAWHRQLPAYESRPSDAHRHAFHPLLLVPPVFIPKRIGLGTSVQNGQAQ